MKMKSFLIRHKNVAFILERGNERDIEENLRNAISRRSDVVSKRKFDEISIFFKY